jgi:phosphoribosylformimino-5-aminoimidazole carboxamide ribotide isomerase
MIVIPAIDIINARCVRLEQGRYENVKKYGLDPVKVAVEYEEAGLSHLHLVDLDGAKKGELVNTEILSETAQKTSLKIDCGGGIKTPGDVEMLFSLGAFAVNLGSAAVKEPEMFSLCLKKYGGEKIILSADVSVETVMINGWQTPSDFTIDSLIAKFLPDGLKRICVTSIKCDGMLQGPDTELYKRLVREYPGLKVTASGGVSSVDDLIKLQDTGVDSAIVGKAIYEKKISLNELAQISEC